MVQFHTQTPCERVGSGTVSVGGWVGGGGGSIKGVHACEWGLQVTACS